MTICLELHNKKINDKSALQWKYVFTLVVDHIHDLFMF
jgi:hypothetical protein